MTEQVVHRLQFRADLGADAGGDEGFLRARVCELDVVDKIGLVIASGGLIEPRREAVISSWTHSAALYATGQMGGTPPVGDGVIFEEGNFLMAEGQYDMEMQAARDAWRTVWRMRDRGLEFSILLRAIDEDWLERDGEYYPTITRYDVNEWSPCLNGVSFNTGVDEMRAGPTQQTRRHPRLKETEARLAALRIRQLEARSTP